MSDTVSTLLSSVGAYVDQTTDAPTGDELTSRISYLDQAQREWAGAYDWNVLHRTSTFTSVLSAVSLGLNGQFKKLESAVTDTTTTNSPVYYQEIESNERFGKLSTDNYVWLLGDISGGMSLQINPPLDGAENLKYDWLAFPTSLATLNDVSSCPNPEFLVKRTIAFVLESRSDPRFPQVKADAQILLNRMIADQDTGSGAKINKITDFTTQGGYVIGE